MGIMREIMRRNGKMIVTCQLTWVSYGNIIDIMGIEQITGWWFQHTPLKNDGVKVSWDDFSFPTEWKVIIHPWFQSPPCHHQPVLE